MIKIKKTIGALAYLGSFLLLGFSVHWFVNNNPVLALIASVASMLIYTLLVIKNGKILSSLSFFTAILVAPLMIELSGNKVDGVFPGVFNEKLAMLTTSLLISFLLFNTIFWAKTKRGFKKIIGLIFLFLSLLILISLGGVTPPNFYQNFVYTRINIAIFLAFSIFLIIRKKKWLGFLGIFLSIGALLLSTVMFADKVYLLEEEKRTEVVAFADPVAKEMLGFYNQEDYNNFCRYCLPVLINMLEKNPLKYNRELFGPYTHLGEAGLVFRRGGYYYLAYPIRFQNRANLMSLTLVIGEISSDPSVYGFAFSESQEK